eukprot:CAMPEP_0198580030 /NCGR_PEP_ID=MMETSP1462-20131121/122335_1 /TAXON_ID=1333877 /ORGANISM="Brandtodinium nutriculum, Strain RCC3387" /LENGTH=68 /DNA_ID=CAMNT_0044311371 /DNA_START=14 /DNA_END=217 /DNA_ORIENTATION=+
MRLAKARKPRVQVEAALVPQDPLEVPNLSLLRAMPHVVRTPHHRRVHLQGVGARWVHNVLAAPPGAEA